jgi:hypothetical protein
MGCGIHDDVALPSCLCLCGMSRTTAKIRKGSLLLEDELIVVGPIDTEHRSLSTLLDQKNASCRPLTRKLGSLYIRLQLRFLASVAAMMINAYESRPMTGDVLSLQH